MILFRYITVLERYDPFKMVFEKSIFFAIFVSKNRLFRKWYTKEPFKNSAFMCRWSISGTLFRMKPESALYLIGNMKNSKIFFSKIWENFQKVDFWLKLAFLWKFFFLWKFYFCENFFLWKFIFEKFIF